MLAATLFLLAGSALAAPQFGKRAVQTIQVAPGGKLEFSPQAIFAETGDEINFVFKQGNFSVFQSSFAAPCTPLDGGFKSGFQFVDEGTADDQLPVVKYTVTDPKDKALWFYGRQGGGAPSTCKQGMLFAINCPSTGQNTFENFVRKATGADGSGTPSPSDEDVITVLGPEPTYAGITIPPYTSPEIRTDVITLASSTWTTTYSSYPGSPTPVPDSENGDVIQVLVGTGNNPTFEPSYVEARPRDSLEFVFKGGNYSIIQSSFAAPCSDYHTAAGEPGINSGYFPGSNDNSPTYRVKVNNTTPLYFYSGQSKACGQGMVFAVNTDEKGGRSSQAFQSLAKQVNGTDGGNTPDEPGSASRASVAGVFAVSGIAVIASLLL